MVILVLGLIHEFLWVESSTIVCPNLKEIEIVYFGIFVKTMNIVRSIECYKEIVLFC